MGSQRDAKFIISPSLQYNIYHHWGSYHRGDGIQGEETARSGKCATEIAYKGGDGSYNHCHRHLYAGIARAAYRLGNMGHCKTDEGDRATERGDYRRQQASDDQQVVADAGGVDTEVFSITLP